MPRRNPLFIGETAATLKSAGSSRRSIEAIIAERERLLAEVDVLRRRGEISRLGENAARLLTHWWSAKSWTARARLLKDADWLVRVEQRRGNRVQ